MILYERKESTGIITLNRPDKRNALHPDMVAELKKKLIELQNDENLKSIIITGSGKAFCAGADLEYMRELRNFTAADNEKDSDSLAELFLAIYNFPLPVIAAVNGAALAGGCGLATVCDYIIADENHAKFGYTEVKIGFIPAIVSIFLIKKIGEGRAAALMLSGEIIDSPRAISMGLVNELSNDVLSSAITYAGKLSQNSRLSMKMTKQMLRAVSAMSVEDAVNYCIRLNAIGRSSDDFINGLTNFLKK